MQHRKLVSATRIETFLIDSERTSIFGNPTTSMALLNQLTLQQHIFETRTDSSTAGATPEAPTRISSKS